MHSSTAALRCRCCGVSLAVRDTVVLMNPPLKPIDDTYDSYKGCQLMTVSPLPRSHGRTHLPGMAASTAPASNVTVSLVRLKM
eukprot:SAG22_NODE_2423_length_2590_cov_1.917302_2_plen_83_part_00